MYRVASMIATAALLLSADTSGVLRAPPPGELVNFPSAEKPYVLQGTLESGDQGRPASNNSTNNPDRQPKTQAGPLQPMSRLSLVRYVDGELVQVVRSIPAGKKGFHMKAGIPLNENALRLAVASAGSAINPGDHAQITNLDFKDK